MAGRGPAPKEQHQRERDTRRRQSDVVSVRADGKIRGPELTASYSPDTVEFYETYRRSAQAQLFEETDWLSLQLVLPLVESHMKRPSAAAASEIRLTVERLGGTYTDRQRAKIRIEHDDDGDESLAPVRTLHAVKTDAKARLRGKQVTEPEAEKAPF